MVSFISIHNNSRKEKTLEMLLNIVLDEKTQTGASLDVLKGNNTECRLITVSFTGFQVNMNRF